MHDRQHQRLDAEHDVAHDFDGTAHPHPASAVAAFEQAVEALGGAALAVAPLVRGIELAPRPAAGIVVDDGHMAEAAARRRRCP